MPKCPNCSSVLSSGEAAGSACPVCGQSLRRTEQVHVHSQHRLLLPCLVIGVLIVGVITVFVLSRRTGNDHEAEKNVARPANRVAPRPIVPKLLKFKVGPLPLVPIKVVLDEQEIAIIERQGFDDHKDGEFTVQRELMQGPDGQYKDFELSILGETPDGWQQLYSTDKESRAWIGGYRDAFEIKLSENLFVRCDLFVDNREHEAVEITLGTFVFDVPRNSTFRRHVLTLDHPGVRKIQIGGRDVGSLPDPRDPRFWGSRVLRSASTTIPGMDRRVTCLIDVSGTRTYRWRQMRYRDTEELKKRPFQDHDVLPEIFFSDTVTSGYVHAIPAYVKYFLERAPETITRKLSDPLPGTLSHSGDFIVTELFEITEGSEAGQSGSK